MNKFISYFVELYTKILIIYRKMIKLVNKLNFIVIKFFLKQLYLKIFFFLKDRFGKAENNTILIHVGKSGGSTFKKAIIERDKKLPFSIIHIRSAVFRKKFKYIILIRGPISRAISAFYWRYKLVVQTEEQRNRFPGEYDVLKKYHSLNNIAENLYDDKGNKNSLVISEINKIHHLRENIYYYLGNFMKSCPPENIICVLTQENLEEDMLKYFNIKNASKEKYNPKNNNEINLSNKAKKNLIKFFEKDYEVITKLFNYKKIKREVYEKILSEKSSYPFK